MTNYIDDDMFHIFKEDILYGAAVYFFLADGDL